jgi:hypothetical protein
MQSRLELWGQMRAQFRVGLWMQPQVQLWRDFRLQPWMQLRGHLRVQLRMQLRSEFPVESRREFRSRIRRRSAEDRRMSGHEGTCPGRRKELVATKAREPRKGRGGKCTCSVRRGRRSFGSGPSCGEPAPRAQDAPRPTGQETSHESTEFTKRTGEGILLFRFRAGG